MQNKETKQATKNEGNEGNYNNITNVDSNSPHFIVTHKNGEIEMVEPEPYIDFNNIGNYDSENSDDNLSEFSEYKDDDFDKNDYLEETLDLDFDLDFDSMFTSENNSEILQFIEIKNKIVHRIKLNVLDLSYIKKLADHDKFELIKLFNHMV
jgi:hypothetical protein